MYTRFKNSILNPKMISVDQMSYESNVFSFSSITPKIYTSMNTLLINGAILDLRLSGVDLNDVYNEGSKSKPEYYLYVEVWDDLSKVGKLDQTARPVIKGLIDNENAEATVKVTADGLLSDHKYYYNVYHIENGTYEKQEEQKKFYQQYNYNGFSYSLPIA